MTKYALWNNKGGVGKSFLTFSLACEYALGMVFRTHSVELSHRSEADA